MSNAQSRKWILVINNPLKYDFTHDKICELLMKSSPGYFCLADEMASTETLHTHIFVYSDAPVRFNTLKNRFPIAHIEKAYGSCRQNRDYIRKTEKWENDPKHDTILEGSFYEYGELPTEADEKSPKMSSLLNAIKDGKSTVEIITKSPEFMFKSADIDLVRQQLLSEEFLIKNRDLCVTYIFGAPGTGKTRGIYEKHQAKDICRITNYSYGKDIKFDAYKSQDVLVFEEFHSQIPIGDMLNYLDIYPLYLPARYSDRVACYTQVYITSNIPLDKQYKDVQRSNPDTWKAFIRRIHHIVEYRNDGTKIERSGDYEK